MFTPEPVCSTMALLPRQALCMMAVLPNAPNRSSAPRGTDCRGAAGLQYLDKEIAFPPGWRSCAV